MPRAPLRRPGRVQAGVWLGLVAAGAAAVMVGSMLAADPSGLSPPSAIDLLLLGWVFGLRIGKMVWLPRVELRQLPHFPFFATVLQFLRLFFLDRLPLQEPVIFKPKK